MKNLYDNQQGIVAIVVTLIFLIVISLTALGLASLARRESRQSLDNQLSTQADYLAQSGINDARRAIADPASGYFNGNRATCNESQDLLKVNSFFNYFSDPVIALGSPSRTISSQLGSFTINNAGYSCVLISHDPATVEYQDISTDKSNFAEMTVVDSGGNPVSGDYDLIVSWEARDGSSEFDTTKYPLFPPKDEWDNADITTGIMRVDLTALGGSFDRNSITTNTMTAFLYPKAGGDPSSAVDFTTSNSWTGKGSVLEGHCNTTHSDSRLTKKCNVRIRNIGTNHIFLRLKSIYNSSAVTISARSGAANYKLKGAQVVIDATGKAADVVKRLQVRVPGPERSSAEYVAESVDGICKRLAATPTVTSFNAISPIGNNDKKVCDPTQL